MVEELIDIRGPLLELPTLANVVKCITMRGNDFEVEDFELAKSADAPSWIRLRVKAKTKQELADCLDDISRLGAQIVDADDARTERAGEDGILPRDAYTLTGLPTEVRAHGNWLPVPDPLPNAAIRVDKSQRAVAVPVERVKKGDRVVVRREGVRVSPEPPDRQSELFGLLGTSVSIARPRGPAIAKVAREMQRTRAAKRKVVVISGPAAVHTGAGGYLEQLIQDGHVDVFIASNALAVYDVEACVFGTSRGVYIAENVPAPHGPQNTIHAMNEIRRAGGLRDAVGKAILTSGILHACITSDVPYVLVGSVRDEAALPDTITDTAEARERLREVLDGTNLAIMIAEADLSKAALQALPGPIPKVYIDVSAYDVNKLVSRGAPTVLGLVESAESFLRELARNLGAW